MKLVLVDSGENGYFARNKRALAIMESNIETCNKLLSYYIQWENINSRVSVHMTRSDFYQLDGLRQLLENNSTKQVFNVINSDFKKNLPTNLAYIPISEVKDLMTSLLRANTVGQLYKNIESVLSKSNKAKNDKDGGHLINFIAY